jgi:hypothetical protein
LSWWLSEQGMRTSLHYGPMLRISPWTCSWSWLSPSCSSSWTMSCASTKGTSLSTRWYLLPRQLDLHGLLPSTDGRARLQNITCAPPSSPYLLELYWSSWRGRLPAETMFSIKLQTPRFRSLIPCEDGYW